MHFFFFSSQWLQIRTNPPSWRETGKPSHLHTYWSLTGGVWAEVVPWWAIPSQWRQWQFSVCLAICARRWWWWWQKQPIGARLDRTPGSCKGEQLHISNTVFIFKPFNSNLKSQEWVSLMVYYRRIQSEIYCHFSRHWPGVRGNLISLHLEVVLVIVTSASGMLTVALASVHLTHNPR